jgi:CRISPR-associated protein Cas6
MLTPIHEDDARLGRLLRLHMQGLSQRDVAEQLDVSQRAVCYTLKRLGIAPNGYHTRTSRAKRARAARDMARLRRAAAPFDLAWEAEWPIVAGSVGPRMGYHAFAALSRLGLVAHAEPGVQLLPLEDRMIFRASEDRVTGMVSRLTEGTVLRIGYGTCRLGAPVVRMPVARSRLESWCVTVKDKQDPEAMRQWCRRELRRLGIDARLEILDRRVIKVKGKLIVGHGVRLARLHRRESLRLLATGLGGRRRFGCGVFTSC